MERVGQCMVRMDDTRNNQEVGWEQMHLGDSHTDSMQGDRIGEVQDVQQIADGEMEEPSWAQRGLC
jgi:hypothetical protein